MSEPTEQDQQGTSEDPVVSGETMADENALVNKSSEVTTEETKTTESTSEEAAPAE